VVLVASEGGKVGRQQRPAQSSVGGGCSQRRTLGELGCVTAEDPRRLLLTKVKQFLNLKTTPRHLKEMELRQSGAEGFPGTQGRMLG